MPFRNQRKRFFAVAAFCAFGLSHGALANQLEQTPYSGVPKLRGYTVVRPMTADSEAAMRESAAGASTVPFWTYSVTPKVDGKTYTGRIVGTNPFRKGAGTTSIPTELIPIIIKISDSNGTIVYDPSKPDQSCAGGVPSTLAAQSPIFTDHPFVFGGNDMGNTQYVDAFQRANFWKAVSTVSPGYHTRLALKTLKAITVTVPVEGSGFNFDFGGCVKLAVIDINWFDQIVKDTLIPAVAAKGVSPRTFPNFLLYNVVMSDGRLNQTGSNCCILGYHSAFNRSGIQTYAVSEYDTSGEFTNTSDVSVLSHEVSEWMNDPIPTFSDNLTPAWGDVGQVQGGCQNNYEVGDPLSGTLLPPVTMPNGHSYRLQELAFFSWFYRQQTTFKINGKASYSNNGAFTAHAGPVCF
ncbi:MAG: hypothetical protein U1E83_00250 [Methylotetracoccus sp.]